MRHRSSHTDLAKDLLRSANPPGEPLIVPVPITYVDSPDAVQSVESVPFPNFRSNLMPSLNLEVGRSIAQSETLSDLLKRCGSSIKGHVSAASVCFWTFDPQAQCLDWQLTVGLQLPIEAFPSQIPLAISLIGLIAQNRQPYSTDRAMEDMCLAEAREWLSEHQLSTFVGYPLVVAGELVGIFALFQQNSLNPLDLETLESLAPAIAAAIDRLQARQRTTSRREAILFRLASHMRNSLDLDTILRAAVDEIRHIFEIDRCNLLWCWNQSPEDGRSTQLIMAITHESMVANLPSLLGECSSEQVRFLKDVVLGLNPLTVTDIEQDAEIDSTLYQLLRNWGFRSMLLVPLERYSGQLGAIICGHYQESRIWSTAEIKLLQAVTDQLAIAMEHADLYAQTRASALAAQTQANQLQKALENLQQAQGQLIQSEKMNSLGQLVAGIAHEINNPVNFIAGNIHHAKDYFDDLIELLQLYQESYPNPTEAVQNYMETIDLEFLREDCTKMLDSMTIGTSRIRDIVVSLRNFSRLDEAEFKFVDIHEGLESTLFILENRIKGQGPNSGITIVKEYGDLPLVECYAGQMNQTFMHILNNAIDALSERSAPRMITLMTEVIPAPDYSLSSTDWIRIRIGDNGSGIPEEIRHNIFDPFFTTKPVGQGTGLGLSMSYKIIIEKHQGSLACESEMGKGTEFIIEIPIQLE